METISKEQLMRLLTNPSARTKIDAWVEPLNSAMEEWSINSPERQAAFLAQVLHESGEFLHVTENLHYSATRLRQVWPSRFPDDAIAREYADNPEKLANKVYASRLGNGDEASGDGWKFRGRGLIQLTGRNNYMRCAKSLGPDVMETPDTLAAPLGAARSAAWYWNWLGLNALADEKPGVNPVDEFTKITKLINGGTIGLESRVNYWKIAKKVLIEE